MKLCKLYKKEKNKVRCLACSQKCLIDKNKTGICGVRKNIEGKLYLLVYNYPCSIHVDPIEKKPLYHFLPNTKTFSIGTVGCNFKCDWCQNFSISQASKTGFGERIFGEKITSDQIIKEALENKCKSLAYTYNEPSIWVEFVKEIATKARKKGLKNVLVTNGYFSQESLDYLEYKGKNLIDAANIDLKSFNNKTYQKFCGAKLEPVLNCIKTLYKKGVHLEITTLIVPGINDNEKELKQIADFIYSLDKKGNIPWHISRFFPMFKMQSLSPTSLEILNTAVKIGRKAGLKFIHLGNV